MTSMDLRDLLANDGHFGSLEKELPEPPNELRPHRRLRLSRLLDQYEIDELVTQQENHLHIHSI